MIRWWLLLAAAGVAVSGCLSGYASLARSSSRPVAAGAGPGIPAAAPGGRGIPALEGKAGSAALPRLIYPSLGINVSARPPAAPGRLAADPVSPGVVLAAFKAQPDASLVGSALRTERPAIMLRAITELQPTARGVRPRVPYPGWVVIYRHVRLVSYGLHSFSKNFRGTFVAIMDAATARWTVFFNQGSSDGEG
jgi:hypothetical protein